MKQHQKNLGTSILTKDREETKENADDNAKEIKRNVKVPRTLSDNKRQKEKRLDSEICLKLEKLVDFSEVISVNIQ